MNAKLIEYKYFTMAFLNNEENKKTNKKYIILIPKKIIKLSSQRNKIKRIILGQLKDYKINLKNIKILFKIKPEINFLNKKELINEIKMAVENIKLYERTL
jgi:ribonuclease P protein component